MSLTGLVLSGILCGESVLVPITTCRSKGSVDVSMDGGYMCWHRQNPGPAEEICPANGCGTGRVERPMVLMLVRNIFGGANGALGRLPLES
ncbi:hypothetical protein BP00DRAFT_181913 [Aspergillus indologenus CBS 114.80]|uniref:Secreted protein n=1 Tax=Aspergillus indologenus CBS 114.80 TaxID=1450541 RepID=A0A2V5IA16_9EURO|nr:hypothetical protein BP00DRAFT_181913 [Aspergillus indologenus CBS 114.80]